MKLRESVVRELKKVPSYNKNEEKIRRAVKESFPKFNGEIMIEKNAVYVLGEDLNLPFKKVGAYISEGSITDNGSNTYGTKEFVNVCRKILSESFGDYNPFDDLDSNIIEFDDGDYLYVEYEDGTMYAGRETNWGIYHEYELPYDNSLSLEDNLQSFIDHIEEGREFEECLSERVLHREKPLTESIIKAPSKRGKSITETLCSKYKLTKDYIAEMEDIISFYGKDTRMSTLCESVCKKTGLEKAIARNIIEDYLKGTK